jgi:hypothetical protein
VSLEVFLILRINLPNILFIFLRGSIKFCVLETANLQFQLSSVKWKDSWGKESKLNIDKE